MNVIGLDIGTTTICAVVTDSDTGEIKRCISIGNDSFIDGKASYEKIQSPMLILKKCTDIVEELYNEFSPIGCIGITGQMHGILYIDKGGNAVSPLYIWQDESGNQPYDENHTYASFLTELTGYKSASGFGCCTYFFHMKNSLVPPSAVCFCTIHDFIAMKLCDKVTSLIHTSDAASFGLFDLEKLCFDEDAVNKAGLDISLFPSVTKDFEIIGKYKDCVPVACAIGDNQASFLGSVSDMENSVLVNLGTGGQVSFLTTNSSDSSMEIRPCFLDKYLCVGASLCGGRAFAVLEEFLRKTAAFVTGQNVKSAYPAIDAFLSDATEPSDSLTADTRFAGTREEPSIRGSIGNISVSNLLPENLILAVMNGMVTELYDMYESSDHGDRTTLVCSGNGLRKNDALRVMYADRFSMNAVTPNHTEEASFGAALFAMTACGIKNSINDAQKLIKNKESL